MKILNTIGSQFDAQAKKILKSIGEAAYQEPSQASLVSAAVGCQILIVGLDLVVDKKTIDAMPDLKIIATPATGLDHIDVAHAEQKGIAVLSLRGEDEFLKTITSTAELALGLLLALVRHIPGAYDSVKQGRWDRNAFCGATLSKKTLGIVGLGRLGTHMASYGRALNMRVIAHDPTAIPAAGITPVDFETLISESDCISLHVHLTRETEHLFNAAAFEKMKKTAYLINTSRGRIVDEAALIASLERQAIAGYATDVLGGELAFTEGHAFHPLIAYAKKHQNVIITPHIGGATVESRSATDIFIANKIKQYVNGHLS